MENVKKRPSMSPVAPLKNQNNSARVTYFTGDSDDSIYRPLHAASSAISNTSLPSAFKHQLSPLILSTIKILAKGYVHSDLGKWHDAATLCIRLRSYDRWYNEYSYEFVSILEPFRDVLS
ncbi:hypothetical protein Tco_0764749 [Tanacetum coccineum]